MGAHTQVRTIHSRHLINASVHTHSVFNMPHLITAHLTCVLGCVCPLHPSAMKDAENKRSRSEVRGIRSLFLWDFHSFVSKFPQCSKPQPPCFPFYFYVLNLSTLRGGRNATRKHEIHAQNLIEQNAVHFCRQVSMYTWTRRQVGSDPDPYALGRSEASRNVDCTCSRSLCAPAQVTARCLQGAS